MASKDLVQPMQDEVQHHSDSSQLALVHLLRRRNGFFLVPCSPKLPYESSSCDQKGDTRSWPCHKG